MFCFTPILLGGMLSLKCVNWSLKDAKVRYKKDHQRVEFVVEFEDEEDHVIHEYRVLVNN